MNLTLGNALKGLIVIIVLVFGAYTIGTCSKPDTEENWKSERAAVLALNDSLVKANAVITSKNDTIQTTIDKVESNKQRIERLLISQRKKTDSLAKINDALYKALPLDSLPPECNAVVAVVEGFRTEVTELRTENSLRENQNSANQLIIGGLQSQRLNDAVKIKNLELANTRVIRVVNTAPVDKDKLFGFITLPSRKASFIIGTISGIGLAIAIDNAIPQNDR